MPSGFQQDTNQLKPAFYRVTINTTGYPTADGNNNGGITPNSSDSFGTLPTTLITGKQRARGNIRFRNIVNRLSSLADCQVLDIEITEANGDAQATTISFTAKYDRDDGILGSVQNLLGSPYTGYDGSTTVNTTLLALKDQVARGIADATSCSMRVYDASSLQSMQLPIVVSAPDVAASLWADVTIALVDGTELVSTI